MTIHPSIRIFIHSFIRPFIHLLSIHPFMYLLINLYYYFFVHAFKHLFIYYPSVLPSNYYLYIPSSTHPSVNLSIHPSIYPPIHLYIHSLIHPPLYLFCMCVYMHECVRMCGGPTLGINSIAVRIIFLKVSLAEFTDSLEFLARELQESHCLCFSRAEVTGACCHVNFSHGF